MRRIRSTAAISVLAAVVVSMLFSSVALAAGWGDPITIWGSNAETYGKFNTWPIGIVNASGSTLVAAYTESVTATGAVDVYVVRSTDGGENWNPRVRVSRPGSSTRESWGRTISAYGNAVDLAWLEDSSSRGIRYTRSLDGGATFSSSISLSSGSAGYPDVARGPNGLVVVGWYAWNKHKLFVRVSHDGGATFDAKRPLWSVPPDINPNFSVAVGDGVIYAGVGMPGEGVLMRRSTDGVTWTSSKTLTKVGPGELGFQLAAEGQQAYLGYTKPTVAGTAPWVRRTTNSGATWAAAVQVAPSAAGLVWPTMRLQGGTVRAIYSRCIATTGPCTAEVYYQQTSNGTTWTAPDPVGTAPAHYAIPMGVTHGDHTVVAYKYWAPINYNGDIQVRIGTD
jgi:hypothetical protein